MADLKIVAADNIKGSGLDLLRKEFGSGAVVARSKYSTDELPAALNEIDALLVRSGTTVTAAALQAGTGRLKLIGRAGVGTDNIDSEAATAKGVVVMNTPLGNTISAAEQAIALIFATARNLARADRLMQAGKWEKKDLVGSEVHGKTLGLVGCGKIGAHVAKVLKAAGMTVLAYDPYLPSDKARQMGVELTGLDELLVASDFITIHTPLTDQTRNLLDTARIAKMKSGARLINCARGGIVDETALAEAVKSGKLAAAGLDVFSTEPMTSGPLFGVKDITLTPHLGASTEEAEERCGLQLAEQVVAFFKEGRLINCVNVSLSTDPSLRPYVEVARAMGRVAGTLLNGPAEQVEVACAGPIAEKGTSSLTASALVGVLSAFGAEDVNLINAGHLARQRGITVSETAPAQTGNHLNRVDVYVKGQGKSCHLGGTAYHNGPRIIQIDDADMDIRLSKHMLFFRYPDRPGYVGKFGTIIANHGVNIANMEVGCLESRHRASMVIGLSEAAPEAMLEELRRVEGVERVYLVSL